MYNAEARKTILYSDVALIVTSGLLFMTAIPNALSFVYFEMRRYTSGLTPDRGWIEVSADEEVDV
jgi:hypothetical protein